MADVVLVFQFILAVFVTVVVLLQKSSSIGLGAYSGSNESVFGAKGPTGFLQKLTFIVGFIFVINTITLGYLYNKEYSKSVVDSINIDSMVPSAPIEQKAPEKSIDPNSAPVVPSAPANQ